MKMLKKLVSFTLLIALFTSSVPLSALGQTQAPIQINGVNAGTAPSPMKSNNVWMLPFAEIFEAAGFDVTTSADSTVVTSTVVYSGAIYGAQTGNNQFDVYD